MYWILPLTDAPRQVFTLALSPDESPAGKLPVNIPVLEDSYQYTDTVLSARGFGLTYQANGKPEPHHGGGGHRNAGTCQVDNDKADEVLAEIVEKLNA